MEGIEQVIPVWPDQPDPPSIVIPGYDDRRHGPPESGLNALEELAESARGAPWLERHAVEHVPGDGQEVGAAARLSIAPERLHEGIEDGWLLGGSGKQVEVRELDDGGHPPS
jgi:hypothetical protein